jgi:mono/diheme cytochrome c family protein
MRFGAQIATVASLIVCVAALFGCAQETFPEQPDGSAGAGNDASLPRGPQYCVQARAESLPARLIALGPVADAGTTTAADGAPLVSGPTWLVSDLYTQFNSICGRCHGSAQGLGGFQVKSQDDFTAAMSNQTLDVVKHITSNGADPSDPLGPTDPMPPFDEPPLGMPYSKRDPTDPVKQFAELIQQWLLLMQPPSFQYALPGVSSAGAGATVPIASAAIGDPMTNIGNCIPNQALLYTAQSKMDALDAMFAAAKAAPIANGVTAQQAIGLPLHLSETDLVTLDSATLAGMGVIAYAPGYPLWSDNAGKLRYIRVPRGTSVVFDKATQSFTIPPNTRFYKTFMKQIVDTDGSLRYRKIETRLIVSRPGGTPAGNGIENPAALFGTYKWSDDESDAVLVTTALNDGAPFGDDEFQYNTNEPLAAALLAGQPADPDGTLLGNGAARHYAIPSSQRCVQCHEGSESNSFILGFLPLQINRRPTGVGGTIEATGPDELTQMQRFIDYGLVTGLTSPSDVLPLEQAEGTRSPRNDYELVAQGYMLGNCAHCHNPGGFPSQQNPVLVPLLNFYPSTIGGIFQFPLERTSPRIFRGITGNGSLPYITPSLMDQPRTVADPFMALGAQTSAGGDTLAAAWYAPWRSLIYRNVDNPFAYTDDSALFPHMPMNTPGYDDRARQLLSDWMVSIPAVRKSPGIPEYAFLKDGNNDVAFGAAVDSNVQPYVEVLPGDPRYDGAVAAAEQRLQILHTGVNPNVPTPVDPNAGVMTDAGADAATFAQSLALSRYATPGDTDDIVDPQVPNHPCNPVPLPAPPTNGSGGLSSEPIPGHCHWVVTDTTQPPGAWTPRRIDWATALVEQQPAPPSACITAAGGDAVSAQAQAAEAVTLLQNITLASATNYLTTPVPFGLWQQKPGCDFSTPQSPPASSFLNSTTAPPPLWMTTSPTPPAPNAPVYLSTPGEAVFKMICINCHGPLADATGRLAQNLATMTGGLDLVADFRDGLFGTLASPDSDINAVFSVLPSDAPPSWTGTTNDDRAARYMAWMALGGTRVTIPPGLLTIVGATPVLDQRRPLAPPITSANMLSTAKALCDQLIGPAYGAQVSFTRTNVTSYSETLIHSNGDNELWMHICSLNNPPPIHVVNAGSLSLVTAFDGNGNFAANANGHSYLVPAPSNFPAGTMIGNERGESVPFVPNDPTNLWPWCMDDPKNVTQGMNFPLCPQAALVTDNSYTPDQAATWSIRGAINAGLGVFLYGQSLEKMSSAPIDYDSCEQLP